MGPRARSPLLFSLALVLAGCATTPPASPALAGDWTPVSAELGGSEFPIASFGGAALHLTDEAYEFAGDTGTYTLLPPTSPARIDIHGVEGPNAGRTIEAIYSLAGDELTVCYQLGAGERPEDLVSPAGTQVLLVRYQRAH